MSSDQTKKFIRRGRIKRRIRGKIQGTTERPRLTVFRSNAQIYAQLVNDENGHTLVSAGSLNKDGNAFPDKKKSEVAYEVGKLLGEKALAANIKTVSFDRNGYLYHGRVKALAEGAREAGLIF
jgi:large subunit ribosomal protein L18